MKLIIFSIRDRAADVFAQPFYQTSVGQAVRSFGDAINSGDKNSNLCLHPDDFDLYELGFFNDEDASFEVHAPKQVAIGKDMMIPK